MRNRLIIAGLFFLMAGALLMGGACRKTNTLTNGGVLRFSDDTLKFDTVFTAAGSYTNWVVIYNPQNDAVVLSSVKLQNGASSYLHLNIDGRTGNAATNIKIAAHDSVYVFATVNINPNDSLTPFVINDALVATLNGKDFTVPITAYGQNAYYIVSDSMTASTTWHTDKPYVVIHNCVIGGAAVLNIPPGCRVYMHQDAQFIVYPGATLNIGQGGSNSDSVVFQGDRLDRSYFGYIGYPGEWCGIWLTPQSHCNISHAVLKNCGGGASYYYYSVIPAAIRVDSAAQLNIDHSTIKNSISIGILSWQGYVNAWSCLVNTTGGQALAIAQGGNDSIVNCTFANYGTPQTAHSNTGTVSIEDWITFDSKHYYYGNMNVVLRNCIVYGSLDSEIICDTTFSPAGTQTRLLMDHCLLKMGDVREPFVQFNSTLFNKDPKFKSSSSGDFHLLEGSPAIGAGAAMAPATNRDGNAWSGGVNIGCY